MQSDQSLKYGHGGASRGRCRSGRRYAHILNQFSAPQNHEAPIQIEERKSHSADALRRVTRLAKYIFDILRSPVLAMTDVFVERGHGAAWRREREMAALSHVLSGVSKQQCRVVDVLDDLRADRMGRPAPLACGRIHGLQQVTLNEPGSRNLLRRNRNAGLAQFHAKQLCVRIPLPNGSDHIARAASDIQNASALSPAFYTQ